MKGWIDLTHPLNADTWIYRGPDYSDPDFAADRWASIEKDDYEVWRLGVSTQMGTHIDAPSHFVRGAVTMDGFLPQDCIGTYRLVTAEALSGADWGIDWDMHSHLLLDARKNDVALIQNIETFLDLPVKTIVMAGELRVNHDDPHWFHRRLAEVGKFLVEDLCVPDDFQFGQLGQIATLPLPLTGLSGSPTRVLLATSVE